MQSLQRIFHSGYYILPSFLDLRPFSVLKFSANLERNILFLQIIRKMHVIQQLLNNSFPNCQARVTGAEFITSQRGLVNIAIPSGETTNFSTIKVDRLRKYLSDRGIQLSDKRIKKG